MSDAAVMTRPLQLETDDAQWIEMDDYICVEPAVSPVAVSPVLENGFIELDASAEVFDNQDDMRFGARTYTPEQADVIHLAVRERKPLKVAPLPLDDE
jgi:hypothetical protein